MLEAFRDSIIPQAVMDLQGTIVEANEAFQNMLKWEDCLTGVNCLALLSGANPQIGVDKIQANLRQKKSWAVETQCTLGDESSIRIEIHFSGVYQGDTLTHILAQVQNITLQHKLTRDLKTQREEIEQFAYIASHDLREPLTSIVGFATLFQRRYADRLDEQGQHWIQEIINGTQNMEQKVDDLLAFSRAGRETPKGTFPLGAALEEAKRALVRMIKASDAVINLEDSPLLSGDRSMVADIFQNLLSNSMKYRREGTAPRITISAEAQKNHRWLIKVTDNGLGFDMKFHNRIFGIFQRLYTIEQYPGTGIGLAIAKKIVERHGGRIWAESAPGKGSTFYFTLPEASL